MNPKVVNIIVLSVIIAIILFGIIGTIITSKSQTGINQMTSSQTRIDQLNQVLSSIFGSKWPYVILMIIIFIFLILGMLYVYTIKEQFNISDESASKIGKMLIPITAIFFLFAVFMSSYTYVNLKNNPFYPKTDLFESEETKRRKKLLIIQLVGAGLFAILLIVGGIYYFMHRRKSVPTSSPPVTVN